MGVQFRMEWLLLFLCAVIFTDLLHCTLLGKAGEKKSLNSTWDGARRMLSEKEALREVLSFIWSAHKERNKKHPHQTPSLGVNLAQVM